MASAKSEWGIIKRYEKLYNLDQQLRTFSKNSIMNFVNVMETLPGSSLDNTCLAGSISEGCFLTRIFRENLNFPDGLNHELELDLELVLIELPETLKYSIEEIPEKPGYVKFRFVKANGDLVVQGSCFGMDIIKMAPRTVNIEGYAQPYKFKNYLSGFLQWEMQEEVEVLIATALKKNKNDVAIAYEEIVTKATISSHRSIKIKGQPYLDVAFDAVPLIRVLWWPAIAMEWKTRQRNWPKQDVIDEISKFAYIIAKPSQEEKENRETMEWRYAFAHVERKLVELRSKQQNLVYLMLKIILVKWIKPIDPEKISSFIAKTIMFWACEKFHREHEMWKKESSMDTLGYLLGKMLDAFQEGCLPYYFNCHVNVIKNIPENTCHKVIEMLRNILSDVMEHLPYPFENELRVGQELTDFIEAVDKNLISCIIANFTKSFF